MKVAIVHDWLTNQGGGERVVSTLHSMFADAPIYTSVYRAEGIRGFEKADIRTSFLQHMPLAKRKHQFFPVLRRYGFESFDFSDFDVVISSSSAEAKGIITSTDTLHISYIHTPTRYYWSGYEEYLKEPGFGLLDPIVRTTLKRTIQQARKWDYAAAQRPDVLVANSQTVADRIRTYYDRDSTIISPPVETSRFDYTKASDKGYYLVVSRLIPYKRVDLAIEACNKLRVPLKVVGRGPERKKLQAMAGPTVEFVENATDKEVTQLYYGAKAFIFPGLEDFGITPVEAMAAGKPVIAFAEGGAGETVVDGQTGTLFYHQRTPDIVRAIQKNQKTSFSPKSIALHAENYSEETFVVELMKLIHTYYRKS